MESLNKFENQSNHVEKHQDYLFKRKKVFGFRKYCVVLENGCILLYHNEDDARYDKNRRGTYNLSYAVIDDFPESSPDDILAYSFAIIYANGKIHTFCTLINSEKDLKKIMTGNAKSDVNLHILSMMNSSRRKKKWIDVILKHIKYSESNIGNSNSENAENSDPTSIINSKNNDEIMDHLFGKIENRLKSVSVSNSSNPSNSNEIDYSHKTEFDSLKNLIKLFIEDTKQVLALNEKENASLKSELNHLKWKYEALEQSSKIIMSQKKELESVLTKYSINLKNENESDESNKDLVKPNSASLNNYLQTAGDDLSDDEEIEDNENLDEYFNCFSRFMSSSESDHLDNKNHDDILNKAIKEIITNNDKESKENQTSGDFDSNGWRLRLPTKQIDRTMSIWSIIKHFIGKDLTRISMPVWLCEPLSLLQRTKESAQYGFLVDKAYDELDQTKRMEYITAYALSPCSSLERLSKPFNPLLGETYEIVREDLGFKSVSEQVSHHPPITAFHSMSTYPDKNWVCYGNVNPTLKFYGKSIVLEAKGLLTLELPNFNETYTWKTASCCVHNVILGTPWFECFGTFEVNCPKTGYKAEVQFKPTSKTNKEINRVEGFIYDKTLKKLKALYGYWTHCLYSCDVNSYENCMKANKKLPTANFDKYFNKIIPVTEINDNLLKDLEELWTVNPMPPHSSEYYKFSYFTMTLNQIKPEFEKLLPPTDSRFRPDVRQLELRDVDRAGIEKTRLEEKQRAAAKARKENEPYEPKWFKFQKHPATNEDVWIFTDKYWSRDYKDCPDIF